MEKVKNVNWGQGRRRAVQVLLRRYIEGRGGKVTQIRFCQDGVVVCLSVPFGQYGLKKLFYSEATVTELERSSREES